MPFNPKIATILIKAEADGHFEKLLHQLNKDFVRAGVTENFSPLKSTSSTGRNLVAAIYSLIISDFERYLNLLYFVDIDEATLKTMPIQRVDEVAQEISILILERELAKVVLKNKL